MKTFQSNLVTLVFFLSLSAQSGARKHYPPTNDAVSAESVKGGTDGNFDNKPPDKLMVSEEEYDDANYAVDFQYDDKNSSHIRSKRQYYYYYTNPNRESFI